MKITDLLGSLVQSGMTQSSSDRMKTSLGGGGLLDSLAGMLGGGAGGGTQGADAGGLLGGLTDIIGGGSGGGSQAAPSGSAGGALGGLLGDILNQAGRAVGGNQNLALGGLGALVGALFGPKKGLGGAVGGGLMALLGAMAFQALRRKAGQKQTVPLGLRAPQTEAEHAELERHSELVLRAMINAAKADGEIDETEAQRLLGRVKESGLDKEAEQFLLAAMKGPMETEKIIADAKGHPDLAAELYGASLLAIEVDTPAEKKYLDQLAAGLGLSTKVTQSIKQVVGLQGA